MIPCERFPIESWVLSILCTAALVCLLSLIMALPLRQRVITLLIITIAGIGGCLWSLL